MGMFNKDKNNRKLRMAAIKKSINSLNLKGSAVTFARKEINELPNILSPDELLCNLISGRYQNGLGLLVCTDRRLIFINKGMLSGIKVSDFPFSSISSIEYKTGILTGKIKIHASGNDSVIDNADKQHTRDFSEFTRMKIDESKASKIVHVESAPQQIDAASQLEKYAALFEKGLITREEFDAFKQKVLNC